MTPRVKRADLPRLFLPFVLGLVIGILPAAALGVQPQTINIDGVNDFFAGNLFDDDTGDTETKNWCVDDPEDESPMDIGQFFVTNDANNLYIGFEYDRDCFASPQVNLGIAFSVGAEGDGGITDPFNRKLAWNTITRKPDYVFYVVVDGFNYEAFYSWNGASWDNIAATINPGYGSGSNGLGMANDLGFEELSLPLSVFGVNPGDDIYIEAWMTQDGTTKPPLDALLSDLVQTSTPAGTVFDFLPADPPVEMTDFLPYTVQADVDTDPPQLNDVTINGAGTVIELVYNEPIDGLALDAGEFSLAGGTGGSSIVGAAIGGASNIVQLTVDIPLTPANYDVSYDVLDEVGNQAISTAHVAYRTVTFRGLFGPYLANNSSPPDGFTVEGSQAPLTFALCDGADMVDTGVDDIWEGNVNFSFPLDGLGQGSKTVEWKFAHNCVQFEDGIGNRSFTLDQDSPSITLLEHWWDDLDPDAFTDKAIKVVYTVDMFREVPVLGVDRVSIGGTSPLVFDPPAATLDMRDDGMGSDVTLDDDVYTIAVIYPAGTLKNSEYKFLYNDVFECSGTGNRQIFLNDEIYDDGLNTLFMPLAYYDRCFAIGRDVEVVFEADLSNSAIHPPGQGGPAADVELRGNREPLSFEVLKGAPVPMVDDGSGSDVVAGDRIYTASVIFPDNTDWTLEYKYFVNGEFEGQGLPNRSVQLNDAFDALGNPQMVGPDDIHITFPVGTDPAPLRTDSRFVNVIPNPFNPKTTIAYEVASRTRVRLDILDVRGRLIASLVNQEMDAGMHEIEWTGLDSRGDRVASGVYYARLAAAGSILSTKLVMLK